MVDDDEAAQGEPFPDGQRHVARRRGRLGGVVLRDGAAHRHPAALAQTRDRRLQVVAADVVEVDVDPLRSGLLQRRQQRPGLVVDRSVESRVVQEPAHLLRTARAPDDQRRALEPGQLSRQRTDRPSRCGHEHPVPGTELSDAQQPRVGGEAGHTEDPQVRLGRRRLGVDDADGPTGQQGVRAPAGVVKHGVAPTDRPTRTVGHVTADRLDDSDGPAAHRSPQRERRHVRRHVVHPPAHVRVHRQEGVADEQLALVDRRQRDVDQLDVLGGGLADRPPDQPPLRQACGCAHLAYQPVVPGPPLNGPTTRGVIQPP